MKILCICRNGFSRSVATRICLNKRGYKDVIAVGGEVTSLETMNMLCKWADKILLAKPEHGVFVTNGNEGKVDKQFTIGEDMWFHPLSTRMHKVIKEQLDLLNY
jgi:hypothetical protein